MDILKSGLFCIGYVILGFLLVQGFFYLLGSLVLSGLLGLAAAQYASIAVLIILLVLGCRKVGETSCNLVRAVFNSIIKKAD
jgi:hypothetical protein